MSAGHGTKFELNKNLKLSGLDLSQENMGYDLIPTKKDISNVTFSLFTWNAILSKVGYIINCGEGIEPASYIAQGYENQGHPYSNDGFEVSEFEAKAMSLLANGYLYVQRRVNKEWAEMPSIRTNMMLKNQMYRQPVSDSFLFELERFSIFAEKSGGFSIF